MVVVVVVARVPVMVMVEVVVVAVGVFVVTRWAVARWGVVGAIAVEAETRSDVWSRWIQTRRPSTAARCTLQEGGT